ncbi:hypothetical protein F8S09_16225 [Deinococcus sp. SDU3-2]|uniref:Phosphoribulokinase/uridine kinase domain-containing protein n=1 Tax=Deinococcus terrestris TaxID=2651870 RepID=A0A7X1TSU5_9DEIO|nr:hypothetical protein [Deinococcus terrestris]MPY68203.1 hypothetical protein [Deinococcus terrestris]
MTSLPPLLTFDALIRKLRDMPWPQEVFIVAIDGYRGSGKRALAERLSLALGAQVLHGDDFYRSMPEEQRAGLSPEQGYMQYLEWQRLRAELTTVRNGSSGSFLAYDWAGTGPRQIHFSPEGWLIVEGVSTLRPELRHLYDLKVYVDTPEELRQSRLTARSGSAEWVKRWKAAEDWYHEHHHPALAADVVISGVNA